MDRLVEVWAPQIDASLRRSAGQRNPSEWFKKEECWQDVQNHLPALADPLPPELGFEIERCRVPGASRRRTNQTKATRDLPDVR
jgi:hypothetical protein